MSNNSPRISFSNDFAEAKYESSRSSRSEPALQAQGQGSSDFEFCVSNYSMMSADELFSKGKLLPFKKKNHVTASSATTTTLRDELLVGEDDHHVGVCTKPPKSATATASTRWKGFLGLKKSSTNHVIASKKSSDSSS